ncbi:hypothetical protein BX265_8450 [Streptomyces sp. TLI_235]|nr:hypothetical protein BX265_8450 [Streptomyces sp. TLI_235]
MTGEPRFRSEALEHAPVTGLRQHRVGTSPEAVLFRHVGHCVVLEGAGRRNPLTGGIPAERVVSDGPGGEDGRTTAVRPSGVHRPTTAMPTTVRPGSLPAGKPHRATGGVGSRPPEP